MHQHWNIVLIFWPRATARKTSILATNPSVIGNSAGHGLPDNLYCFRILLMTRMLGLAQATCQTVVLVTDVHLEDRVGDGVAPVALSHHRTCGSAYGGSLNMLEASLGVQQRNQPEFVKEAFWIGRVHVACSGVPPRTASVACRFPCSRFIQSSRL